MKEYISVSPIEYSNVEFSLPILRFEVLNSIHTSFEKSQIIFATSESGKKLVIKIPAKGKNASREWEGLKKAYKAEVLVPEPLALVTTQEGAPALISEWIEGTVLFRNTDTQLRSKIGLVVLGMHENVVINENGWLKSGKPTFIYYDGSLFKWSRETNNQLGSESKVQEIIKKFAATTSSYCKIAVPVFNHNDIHEGQVIVRPTGDVVLLDFENWREDTKLNDIAYYLFQLIRTNSSFENYKEFLKGYLGTNTLTDGDKSVLSFYLLFISARALNYFITTKSKYLNIATDTHNRVLKFIEEERLWKDI